MATIRHSFAWWAFAGKNTDAKTLLQSAARLGYQGVEMIPEDLWGTVREAGLCVASTQGHKSLTDGLNKRSNHNRIEDELKANIAKAKKHGIPVLICFSGNREGLADSDGIGIVAEGLNRSKKEAEAAGVTLALELLNSKVDHLDYQCDHTPWGVEVIKRVNSPRVKLLYDIYHMQIMEGDLIRTIREHIQHIGHFHTAGNPGRKDLDTEQEIYYPAVIKAIAATNYEGFLGQEFSPKSDPLKALEAALKSCRP